SEEDGFISEDEETYKGLRHVRNILDKKQATFVMDRDYDNIKMMKQILGQGDNFVIRLKKNRHLLYQNKKRYVHNIELRRKDKIKFRTQIQETINALKVTHITVEIHSVRNQKLTLVVVYDYGKDPMVLLTNKRVKQTDEVLSILQAYI